MSIKQKTMSPYIKNRFKQMGKDYTKYKGRRVTERRLFSSPNRNYIRQKIIGSFWYQLQQTTTLFPKEIGVARSPFS